MLQLSQEFRNKLIDLINKEWVSKISSADDYDFIQTDGTISTIDLSKITQYFELKFYYDIGNDVVTIEYKSLNDIVNNWELKFCLTESEIVQVDKILVDLSKYFADDVNQDFEKSRIIELYQNDRLFITNKGHKIILDDDEFKNFVNKYSN
jgi:hypothetical protein